MDFQLAAGAGVRGRIIGPDSEDLVQVNVLLYDETGVLAGTARSDSLGHYRIEGLPAGTYYAQTANNVGLTNVAFGGAPCVGTCTPTDGEEITVPESGLAEEIDFVLLRSDPVFGDRFE